MVVSDLTPIAGSGLTFAWQTEEGRSLEVVLLQHRKQGVTLRRACSTGATNRLADQIPLHPSLLLCPRARHLYANV